MVHLGPCRGSEVDHAIVEKCWHFNFTFRQCDKTVLFQKIYKMQHLGFHLPWADLTALGGVRLGLITLSFGHPCIVHVIFIQI